MRVPYVRLQMPNPLLHHPGSRGGRSHAATNRGSPPPSGTAPVSRQGGESPPARLTAGGTDRRHHQHGADRARRRRAAAGLPQPGGTGRRSPRGCSGSSHATIAPSPPPCRSSIVGSMRSRTTGWAGPGDCAPETTRLESGGLLILIGADAEAGRLPAEIALDARGYVLTGPECGTRADGRATATLTPRDERPRGPGLRGRPVRTREAGRHGGSGRAAWPSPSRSGT